MSCYFGVFYTESKVSICSENIEDWVVIHTDWLNSASCSVASHFNQIDSLQWTPHLDTCLRSLEISEDKPFDATLVFEARLHHIVQKAASFYRQSDGASPATMLYMSALRDQLWEVKVPQLSNAGIRGKIDMEKGAGIMPGDPLSPRVVLPS